LLQRPNYDSEPLEAAARFAEIIKESADDLSPAGGEPVEIGVSLIEIPSGDLLADYSIKTDAP
jgi:hypothetical protein